MKVVVAGVGLIGKAWAVSFARAGHDVVLWGRRPEAAREAFASIGRLLEALGDGDALGGLDPAALLQRITIETDLASALAGADYVQENTAEDLEVKKAVFELLDRLAPASAILASSTSSILPSLFCEALPGRSRCLVVHPINPPYLVPAVEVVPSQWTDERIVRQAVAFLRSVGQAPILMPREIDGFLMNRLQGAVMDEAFRLVAEGYASAEDVDAGMRDGLGLRWSFMGPFETIDLNSPGGVREYAQRYDPLYANLFTQRRERVQWSGAVLDEVSAERRTLLPLAELEARREWRDYRLAALIRHKREQERATADPAIEAECGLPETAPGI